jgi:CRISPR/Cas system-associated endoribonuclease Cas2
MEKHLHFIADDFQRRAMIQTAVAKAIQLVQDSFFQGLMIDALDDLEIVVFAGEAWKAYARVIEFDYPTYAEALFLQAYRMAYRVYQRDLPHGIQPSAASLAEAFEAEIGLAPSAS